MMIVGTDGEMQVSTTIDNRWDVREIDRWPLAAVASSSGKSIVWLKDKREKRFLSDDGESLTDRIEGISVYDALMRDDGILVLFQNGKKICVSLR